MHRIFKDKNNNDCIDTLTTKYIWNSSRESCNLYHCAGNCMKNNVLYNLPIATVCDLNDNNFHWMSYQ